MALFISYGMHVLAAPFCFMFADMVSAATIQSPGGFSITMIPRYSRNSPGSPSNLTDEERYALMLQSSHRRANRLASMASTDKNGAANNGTRLEYAASPKVFQALDSHYIVQIGIGTPLVTFFLLLDTGSSDTWVQIKGRTVCFPYKHDGYDFLRSSSFQYLHCDHPKCVPKTCHEDVCSYRVGYADRSTSFGGRALETFTVYSARTGRLVAIRDTIFGLGLENDVKWYKNDGPENEIAGVFGMGTGPLSFISQLNMAGERRCFSHCLTHWTSPDGGHSLLKFGSSASIPPGAPVYTTPLVSGTVKHYYVNLLHISVNGNPLNFRSDLFRLHDDGVEK